MRGDSSGETLEGRSSNLTGTKASQWEPEAPSPRPMGWGRGRAHECLCCGFGGGRRRGKFVYFVFSFWGPPCSEEGKREGLTREPVSAPLLRRLRRLRTSGDRAQRRAAPRIASQGNAAHPDPARLRGE